ncbi:uncharacterized protein [Aegilops tauschii subsp. strangulata]|uniref:uncharacterized protein n=1 Tax=Aegilops tauschii subsp. strangulata TaxID=200361 RepID=UPI00098B5E85|nr:uncharacterized protein LOC109758135 [Aegilops tauschii subsp. strangulata]
MAKLKPGRGGALLCAEASQRGAQPDPSALASQRNGTKVSHRNGAKVSRRGGQLAWQREGQPFLRRPTIRDAKDASTTRIGGQRFKSFAQRPTDGTRGGILLLWDEDAVQLSNVHFGTYYLSALVTLRSQTDNSTSFKLTAVYGPTRGNLKDAFFGEPVSEKPPPGTMWLVTDDFNQIYRARDKNRANADRSRIVRFRNALNSCELKEIHLQNKRFTWSNDQSDPTLSKLDSFFCNEEWDLEFGSHILHALSSSPSDHCPLLLANANGPKCSKCFRLRTSGLGYPGFCPLSKRRGMETIAMSSPATFSITSSRKLVSDLNHGAKHLSLMSRSSFICILRLDVAHESRSLSPDELDLRKRLKRRVIGLAVLEKARKRQMSRITYMKEGDANTRFFHHRVNRRRRKNFIHRLKHNGGWVTDHDHKKAIIHSHFSSVIKKGPRRQRDFNWEGVPTPDCDLSDIGSPFTEEEARRVVFQSPSNKAPGPDGFTGAFFKACWDIIKVDVMAAIDHFSNLHASNFHWLNSANIALIPKKDGAEDISDFRPIHLIHVVAKLTAKMMASRLAVHMDDLVSQAQSAFIKKRSIHDNFTYVRNLARRFHRSKTPMLLFKLDIKKAFDSVRCDYLLDLLQHLGFPVRFRGWVSALLSSASSRVLLNGTI